MKYNHLTEEQLQRITTIMLIPKKATRDIDNQRYYAGIRLAVELVLKDWTYLQLTEYEAILFLVHDYAKAKEANHFRKLDYEQTEFIYKRALSDKGQLGHLMEDYHELDTPLGDDMVFWYICQKTVNYGAGVVDWPFGDNILPSIIEAAENILDKRSV